MEKEGWKRRKRRTEKWRGSGKRRRHSKRTEKGKRRGRRGNMSALESSIRSP